MKTFLQSTTLSTPNGYLMRLLALRVMLPILLLYAPAQALSQTPVTPGCNPQLQCCTAPPGSGSPACGVAAGNPLNTLTGNKFQVEVDMPALPGVLGLELIRYYNSELSGIQGARSDLGRGWRLSYDAQLVVSPGAQAITHIAPDGTHTRYSPAQPQPQGLAAGTMLYRSSDQGQLLARSSGRGTSGNSGTPYTLTHANNVQHTFSATGKLTQILAPTGHSLSIQRNANGQLLKVTDPQGRSLTLSYLDEAQARVGDQYRGVQHIDSPVGRYSYHYGSPVPAGMNTEIDKVQLLANLSKVDLAKANPAIADVAHPATSRYYHYEDPRWPTLLTGISLHTAPTSGNNNPVASQRLVTWAYDAQARAVLSVKGQPARLAMQAGPDGKPGNTPQEPKRLQEGTGTEQVTLQFKERKPDGTGLTVLTNSLGQETQYAYQTINGQKYLSDVLGPGCATCGSSNQRNIYNPQGQITSQSQLDERGQVIQIVQTEYDSANRPIQISLQRVVDGRTQPLAWQVRYRYANALSQQPSRVSRPSAVPGQEHQISVNYNTAGQIIQQTETGFSPLDDKGQIAATPTQAIPIQRTTTYSYSLINNRSVLTQIDGPLPNGPTNSPTDSDITTLEYDPRADYIIATTQPGGFKSTLRYDSAGRIATVQNAEGFATTFTFEVNLLTQISSAGPGWAQPNIQSFKYDSLGRAIETGTGSRSDKSYRPQLAQAFDLADRTLWSASALGILQHKRFDTEGRLLHTSRGSNAMMQIGYNRYDALGHLQATWSNDGQGYDLSYNAQGQVQSITDDMGRTTNLAVALTTQASNAQAGTPTAAARPRQLTDDFGRTVATFSPNSGLTTRTFDTADRLIASVDALGHRGTYTHDAAGRIVKQTIVDAVTGQASTTTWTYQGKRLMALEHPSQSERYEYDSRGLRTTKITTLHAAQGQHTAVTRYRYDEVGILQSTSLPDGSYIIYKRNGQGQVEAVNRSQLQTPWLQQYAQWLLPAQTVVQDLQRDIVGLKSYQTGNGIQALFQRSKEGKLARVVYRSARATQLVAHQPPAVLVGRMKQETISALLGVGTANAADTPKQPAAASGTPSLPGALNLPADPQALLDHRYLWDTAGNLLLTQAKASFTGYSYDSQDRLVIASQAAGKLHDAKGTPDTHDTAAPTAQAVRNTNSTANTPPSATYRYAYQGAHRVLAQEGIADSEDLQTATRKVSYQSGSHRWLGDGTKRITQVSYNANGQPGKVGSHEYVWDALGRLVEVRQENKTYAAYTYNHRGERVGKTINKTAQGQTTRYLYENGQVAAELNEAGQITRQYLYLADQPIAVIDSPFGKSLSNPDLPAQSTLRQDVQTILKSLWHGITSGDTKEHTTWLHSNHLGAPEAATDATGQLIWQASYAPFGQVSIKTDKTAAFRLNLRLPGQYEDAETGLFYNKQRYYDPNRGEYLTPDPLGAPDGPNGYAYVRYNPLKYIDPEGLILFAFDGTGNDESNQNTLSNVVEFRNRYQSDSGKWNYITGVGTRHQDAKYGDITAPFLDSGGNFSGRTRIARMVQYFNDEADTITNDNEIMQVDITGFSRGAAQARDFANRITSNTANSLYKYQVTVDGVQVTRCQKVNFRFLGLYDTVLSTDLGSGESYNLAIPTEFAYVAHAVALNEYRGSGFLFRPAGSIGAFPVESIMQGQFSSIPIAGQTRIERGFLGSHSDVGGGFEQGDLSRISLDWMVSQARLAGVDMSNAPSTIATSPVLHDKSDAMRYGQPRENSEDRTVRYRDGSTTTGRNMVFSSGMTYADTQQFITYGPRYGPGYVTGTVDSKAYIAWLNSNGYDIKIQ
jgi:RHS repeat-associated protein